MTYIKARQDTLGIASCVAFIISAMLFYHVKDNHYFTNPRWDLAFGGAALLGMILALAGIARAIMIKRMPVFSMIGVVLNLVPLFFMLMVIPVGDMH